MIFYYKFLFYFQTVVSSIQERHKQRFLGALEAIFRSGRSRQKDDRILSSDGRPFSV